MKIVDANVLLYAANTRSPYHDVATGWLTQALSGGETLGMPWICLVAFIRISTNPRTTRVPITSDAATGLVRSWLSRPNVVTPEPGPRHVDLLSDLLERAGIAGDLTNDAHIAALAIEHRAAVASFDRDFARFGVEILVPGA